MNNQPVQYMKFGGFQALQITNNSSNYSKKETKVSDIQKLKKVVPRDQSLV